MKNGGESIGIVNMKGSAKAQSKAEIKKKKNKVDTDWKPMEHKQDNSIQDSNTKKVPQKIEGEILQS